MGAGRWVVGETAGWLLECRWCLGVVVAVWDGDDDDEDEELEDIRTEGDELDAIATVT